MNYRALLAVSTLSTLSMFAGCGGGGNNMAGGSQPTGPTGSTVPASRHVVMLMEENQSYSTVVGNTASWPALNKLMSQGALATNYFADTHPSIGNYFMLTTGQTLTNNDSSTTVWNVDNIARRMISGGVSFKVYAEGISRGYAGGDIGNYVIRHNPFAMLSDVAGSPETANQYIWPFSQFATDAAANNLPAFSFIIPNTLDDAHTGSPLAADHWLQAKVVGPLSATTAFKSGGDGILIVDFDEAATADTTHGGGHVAAVFWGPLAKSAFKQSSSALYQHQSMLATVMVALGLSSPPGQAASAATMGEFFNQP